MKGMSKAICCACTTPVKVPTGGGGGGARPPSSALPKKAAVTGRPAQVRAERSLGNAGPEEEPSKSVNSAGSTRSRPPASSATWKVTLVPATGRVAALAEVMTSIQGCCRMSGATAPAKARLLATALAE